MIRLGEPWLLLVAALAVGMRVFLGRRRPAEALPFSDVTLLDIPTPISWRRLRGYLPNLLLWIAFGCLVSALCRPQLAVSSSAVRAAGLTAVWILDVSGSMGTGAIVHEGRPLTHLDQAQDLVRRFLLDETGYWRRPHDRMALIKTAALPTLIIPPTEDHASFLTALDRLQVERLDNRTNLGDALVQAFALLEAPPGGPGVVILVTDGAQTVPEALAPITAGRIADALGFRVHVIAVGQPVDASAPSMSSFTQERQVLAKIAQLSHGVYLDAGQVADPARIAEVLGQRESSPAIIIGYRDWHELFPVFVLLGLGSWALGNWLRQRGIPAWPDYSLRSASTGSTDAARRAG